jgi:acyl carrier protein
MPETDMTAEILKLVSEYLDVPVSELTPEKTFEDLGVDSLDFAEIVFDVEEKIGIKAQGDLGELRARIHCLGDVIVLANELARQKLDTASAK